MPLAPTFRSGCRASLRAVIINYHYNLITYMDERETLKVSVGGPAAVFNEVMFKQHSSENCIAECSKCLFVVACRSMCVSVGVRRRGHPQVAPSGHSGA